MRWDGRRALAGLAPHPSDAGMLFTLGVDGSLAGHAAAPGARGGLACLWGVALAPPSAPLPPAAAVAGSPGAPPPRLAVTDHPARPGDALVAADAGPGRGLVLLCAPRRAPPTVAGHDAPPAAAAPLGLGFTGGGSALLWVGAGLGGRGSVVAAAWAVWPGAGGPAALAWARTPPPPAASLQAAAAGGSTSGPAWGGGRCSLAAALIHPRAGALVLRRAAPPLPGPPAPRSRLAPAAAAAAAASLRAPVVAWAGEGVRAPPVAAVHTPVAHDTAPSRTLPAPVYLVDGAWLCVAPAAGGGPARVCELPAADGGGAGGAPRALAPTALLHSPSRRAWAVFFDAPPASPKEARGGAFTLLVAPAAAAAAGTPLAPPPPAWTAPAAGGAFAGDDDRHLLVLEPGGRRVQVFSVAHSDGAPAPARTLDLPGGGPRAAIFPGPRWGSLPTSTGAPAGGGSGTVAWQAGPGAPLCLGDVAGRSLSPARALATAPGEMLTSVVWQPLVQAGGERGGGGASVVAGVLTTDRLILATAALAPLAVFPSRGHNRPPLTSILWAGPALLVADAGGGVWLAGWDGALHPLASLGASCPASLAAAAPDRLLVARGGGCPRAAGAPAGGASVAHRALPLLIPLALAWAGAAAAGVLPGGVWRARKALAGLMAAHGAEGGARASVLTALAAAGFPREAAALAGLRAGAAAGAATDAERDAAAALAGDWRGAVAAAVRSAARGGAADRARAVDLARAALGVGAIAEARALFEAAGAVEEAACVAAAVGDVGALEGSDPVPSALADVLGPAWQRRATLGAVAMPGSWSVSFGAAADADAGAGDDEPLPPLAQPGAHPPSAVPPAAGGTDAGGGLPALTGAAAFVALLPPGAKAADCGGDSDGGGGSPPTRSADADAQAAARAAWADGFGAAPAAAGSDSDDASDGRSVASSAAHAAPPRFRVVIRAGSGGVGAADADALRAAAASLRLAPPAAAPSGGGAFGRGGGGDSDDGESTAPSLALAPSFARAPGAPPVRAALPVDFADGGDSGGAARAASPPAAASPASPDAPAPGTGEAMLEAGDWDAAATAFEAALEAARAVGDGGGAARAARYMAAALLLAAAAAVPPVAAARLARHAAGLPLAARHADALGRSAAARGARVGARPALGEDVPGFAVAVAGAGDGGEVRSLVVALELSGEED